MGYVSYLLSHGKDAMQKEIENPNFSSTTINDLLDNISQNCIKLGANAEVLKSIEELKALISMENNRDKTALSVQFSLYPLRQASLSAAIMPAIEKLGEYSLEIFPGAMSTIVSGEADEIWKGLQTAFQTAAKISEVVMVLTVSNACHGID